MSRKYLNAVPELWRGLAHSKGSLADIAQAIGVSRSTVSIALGGYGCVSTPKELHILDLLGLPHGQRCTQRLHILRPRREHPPTLTAGLQLLFPNGAAICEVLPEAEPPPHLRRSTDHLYLLNDGVIFAVLRRPSPLVFPERELNPGFVWKTGDKQTSLLHASRDLWQLWWNAKGIEPNPTDRPLAASAAGLWEARPQALDWSVLSHEAGMRGWTPAQCLAVLRLAWTTTAARARNQAGNPQKERAASPLP